MEMKSEVRRMFRIFSLVLPLSFAASLAKPAAQEAAPASEETQPPAKEADTQVSPWRQTYDAGHAAIDAGDYDKAMELFAKAEEMSYSPRGKSPAANGQGLAMLRARKYGNAILHFERALQHDSENRTARSNLGFTHLKMYHLGLADRVAIEKAIEILTPFGDEAPPTLSEAKSLLAQEDRWAEAEARTPTTDPTGKTWRQLVTEGEEAENEGWFDFAAKCYTKAEEISKSTRSKSSAANRIGLAYMKARRHEEAAAHLERAVSIEPESKIFLNNLGVVRLRLFEASAPGDHLEKAIEAFKKVAEIDPEYRTENLKLAENYQ